MYQVCSTIAWPTESTEQQQCAADQFIPLLIKYEFQSGFEPHFSSQLTHYTLLLLYQKDLSCSSNSVELSRWLLIHWSPLAPVWSCVGGWRGCCEGSVLHSRRIQGMDAIWHKLRSPFRGFFSQHGRNLGSILSCLLLFSWVANLHK